MQRELRSCPTSRYYDGPFGGHRAETMGLVARMLLNSERALPEMNFKRYAYDAGDQVQPSG